MNQKLIEGSVNKLFDTTINNYIFIYTPPKVGSTTLVTSLRVSLGKSYNIIHIHDEIMLSVLTGITNVKINDIIYYLSNKGNNIYVVDVYRTPIERKMSEYFEKLSPYHFNNSEENITKYSMKRITDRFNKIFPHIENGDHYFEKYEIEEPIAFDFDKKYSLQEINKIKYIKLRLRDSELWGTILSNILKTDIIIIHDYKTEKKGIGELYNRFKNEYKLPENFLELIKGCKYFNFYNNEAERNNYLTEWNKKLDNSFISYTDTEYKFYINLCLENQHIQDIQLHHYIDNGCFCKYCNYKRKEIFLRYKEGEKNFKKIIHSDVINEIANKRVKEISFKINQHINSDFIRKKNNSKLFKINISNA